MEPPSPQPSVHFRGFTLHPEDGTLFRDGEVVPLRPKALAMLVHLVARRPRLVTKEELLDAVWSDAVVGDWVLTTAVKELRQALGDDPRRPGIIETSHRRGYRFIASTSDDTPKESAVSGPGIVGRSAELTVLDEAYRIASTGRRQVVFVAGEAGIGKTALVDAFLARRTGDPSCLVAHGQGVEQFSTAEPYLPLLDALGRLATSEHGRRFARVLARLAPSWKGLLPGLSDGGESPAAPASPESMLREMVRAIEAVESPLVLVLEDLHWSDYATLDVLHRLARGRAPAPVLVVVTYRAAELAMREHPLKTMHRELRAQSLCQDVWLPPLATGAIGDYVARRFPGLENVAELAGQIASRTDGNALFMVNVTDELETAGTVVRSEAGWKLDGNVTDIATAVPPGLRQLLVMRTDRLDAQDRDLLEACSVVGRVSCAEEAAAALELPVHEVDTALATVARRHFLLRDAGQSTWPDGSVSGRYEFAHSLYRDVLLEQAPPARRRLWHERVARRIEAGYRGRTTEVASILARHLEAAGLGDAAIPYLEEAAERAWRYGAEREGVALLDHAVAILESLPKSPERMLKTIRLSIGLGQVLQASHGYASRDSETAFARAWKLADELDDVVQLFQASVGLISSYVGKARFEDARRVAERLPELMSQIPLPPFTLAGHLFIGIASYHSGLLTEAQAHFDAALAVGEVVQPAIITNFHVVLLSYRALTFAHRGERDEALASAELARRRAETERPFDQASAATWCMFVHLIFGKADGVEAAARTAEARGAENGYALPTVVGRFGSGWCAARRGQIDEGLATMRGAIEDFRASGHATALPAMLASMAAVAIEAGRLETAIAILADAEALIESSSEVLFAAEVRRLQGECRAATGDVVAARDFFERALELARGQGAGWWEARAHESLQAIERRRC
jgi:DNA-binding winged helix-turn-helix (wHTH) protein/tetratricopeptide (TPR) repeat protein